MADVRKGVRTDCKMKVILPKLIPAPPDRKTFIRDSHFQFSYDHRPESSTLVSPFQIDYPPRWGRYHRMPIRPARSGDVLNQDMDNSWDTRSETCIAYPSWPVQPKPEITLLTSYLQPHADPRQKVLTSVTHESYPCPTVIQPYQPSHIDKWVDSCPRGDQEKILLPSSLYNHSYQTYEDKAFAIKAPCQHLGDDSILKGDDCTRHNTMYRSMYTAKWGPPAQLSPKEKTYLVFGDPRYHQVESEQKHSYTVQKSDGCRYDPEVAAAKVFQTNIQPGDGCHRFSTNMSEFYPRRDLGTALSSSYKKNASSILRGDLKDSIGISNYQSSYREPNVKSLEPQEHPAKDTSNICMGDNRLSFFSTTQQLDYPSPSEIYKVDIKGNNQMKTNFVFNYPAFPLRTSTQDMLVPHQQPKHQVTEEEKQKIKYSHLVHPWKDLRWLCTEQKDKYTNKYSGPITLGIGDFQRSSIPLGTMKNYKTRQKNIS